MNSNVTYTLEWGALVLTGTAALLAIVRYRDVVGRWFVITYAPYPEPEPPTSFVHLRGVTLCQPWQIEAVLDQLRGSERLKVYFRLMNFRVGMTTLRYNLFIQGAPGSGKTALLDVLLLDLLRFTLLAAYVQECQRQRRLPVVPGLVVPRPRIVLFDGKGKHVEPVLRFLQGRVKTYVLDPFNENGSAWALWQDVESFEDCVQLSYAIVRKDQKVSDAFWSMSARHVVTLVLLVFVRAGGRFNLNDIYNAAAVSVEVLAAVLAGCEETRREAKEVLKRKRLVRDIIATVRSNMAPLLSVAARWRQSEAAGRTFSANRFMKEIAVLFLGHSDAHPEITEPVVEALIDYIAGRALGRASDSHPTFFWMDECQLVRQGKNGGLKRIVAKGRESSAVVLAATQSVGRLKSMWGSSEDVDAFIAACGNRVWARVESFADAKYAADFIGSAEVKWLNGGCSETRTTTASKGGGSTSTAVGTSVSESVAERAVATAGEIKSLPVPAPNWVCTTAYVDLREAGVCRDTLDIPTALGDFRPSKTDGDDESNTLKDVRLVGWSAEDVKRLRLKNPFQVLNALASGEEEEEQEEPAGDGDDENED
jgi:hypothetical protein